MLIVETLNQKNKPILYAKINKKESIKNTVFAVNVDVRTSRSASIGTKLVSNERVKSTA
jgi:hypothetical protein